MSISLTVNNKLFNVKLQDLPIDITLNTFIREHVGLTGTKFMCLEGGCGACICVLKGRHPATKEHRIWATNSCLTLLNACDGLEVTTIEGIGNKNIGYHPIQKRLADLNGSQCGYCSPAMVMNMYGLMESSTLSNNSNNLTMKNIENSFAGNMCRCTGYRPILDAMKSFANNSNIDYHGDIEDLKICAKTGNKCTNQCTAKLQKSTPFSYVKYNNDSADEWHSPKTINEIFNIFTNLQNQQKYLLVAGNTAHGVYRRSTDINIFIDLNQISELYATEITETEIKFGSNVNLTEAMNIFEKLSSKSGFEYCAKLYHHFDLIANIPVRNMGTLIGNLMIKNQNNEFPSDVFITFEALNAQITILDSITGQSEQLSPLQFVNTNMYKKIATNITLPIYPTDKYLFNSYKIMPRAQNAHAYVNAAFLIQIENEKVIKAQLCFGGISPTFCHATITEQFLINQQLFDVNIIKETLNKLNTEIQPNWILPDSSPEYRKLLACGLFYRFLLSEAPSTLNINKLNVSGKFILEREVSRGIQTFDTNEKNYPITKPIPKIESLVQCAGEAFYMNDLPKQPNQVYAAFVHATNVNSKIVQIDANDALQIPDVIAFLSAKDIPGNNSFVDTEMMYMSTAEEIFCSSEVKYFNQPVGVIIANSTAVAEKAAKFVKIMYEKGENKVLTTLQDVFENKAYNRIVDFNGDETFENMNIIASTRNNQNQTKIVGYLDIGGQYHYTMEPQTTICIPTEDGMDVHSASQWMDFTQSAIAKALKMKQSNIHLQVRRLGGGFGSKITRNCLVACACAVASLKLNRPVRFVQSIESMMGCLGKRYACHSDYEIETNQNGKIVSLKNVFYEDAGCTANESPVEFLSKGTAKNCYQYNEKWNIIGKAVLTDAPSHTWCRAPGGVEGIGMMENIIEHIAYELKMDPVQVRLNNLPKDNKMQELLPKFVKSIEYDQRKMEIEKFNTENRWRKKGLGIALMEYPIDYFGQFASFVSIYHSDGSVAVSHGGIEMGQGIHTKVAQTAAFTLKIPLDMVRVVPSDSFTDANSFVTGAAITSESVCFAVKKACEILLERLKPIRDRLKNPTWQDIITAAFNENYSLSANSSAKIGELKGYIVWGLACTEVEIDILTGNLLINRVDILEDTGESLNPSIDIGQIEGAFVMGLGYWLTEQLIFNRETGELLTNRTWTYKPPGVKDIPIDFRINLLQKSPNPAGFLRSKATGEPAACLSVSALFGIRHAIMSARTDAGINNKWIHLGAPTTPEHIVLNSGTSIDMFTL